MPNNKVLFVGVYGKMY